jgi:two-component system, NtrC family, nitrogen regulation response regulator GlnG
VPSDETWARYLDSETRSRVQAAERPDPDPQVPGLTILCHPDVRRIGERVALVDLLSRREVAVSRLGPLFSAPDATTRRPLADPYLSRRPFQLLPAKGSAAKEKGAVLLRDPGGEVLVEGEPVAGERLLSAAELADGVTLLLAERVCLLLHLLHPSPQKRLPRFAMIGDSPAMIRLRQAIQQIAELSLPVLLRGETGTGKELVARALHDASPRRARPYLAVNMGAIPTALVAAELFGAARGAYTGADRRREGYFERANGGTLFLDEIGEVPAEIQIALLRVLETGEAQPVGDQPRRVDVRVIAAPDADLEAKVATGELRAPLLHRLGACQITLPPLRERRDDIGRLLVHFLAEELAVLGSDHLLRANDPRDAPWLSASLVARLTAAPWPGNVRQLRNVARQLAASCHHEPAARITEAIAQQLASPRPESRAADPAPLDSPEPQTPRRKTFRRPEEVSEEEVSEALRANRWRLQPAAAQLGVSRTALYGLIDRFPSIRKPRDLSRDEIARCYEEHAGDLEAMVDVLRVSRKGLKRRMTELGLE